MNYGRNTINKNEELRCNSSLYFLFKIFEGIRIKEFGDGYFKPITDYYGLKYYLIFGNESSSLARTLI